MEERRDCFPSKTEDHLSWARNVVTYDIPKVPGSAEAKRYKERSKKKRDKKMNTSNGKN